MWKAGLDLKWALHAPKEISDWGQPFLLRQTTYYAVKVCLFQMYQELVSHRERDFYLCDEQKSLLTLYQNATLRSGISAQPVAEALLRRYHCHVFTSVFKSSFF